MFVLRHKIAVKTYLRQLFADPPAATTEIAMAQRFETQDAAEGYVKAHNLGESWQVEEVR
jgi:hypothetical protein